MLLVVSSPSTIKLQAKMIPGSRRRSTSPAKAPDTTPLEPLQINLLGQLLYSSCRIRSSATKQMLSKWKSTLKIPSGCRVGWSGRMARACRFRIIRRLHVGLLLIPYYTYEGMLCLLCVLCLFCGCCSCLHVYC
jgi:hypothetical protein